MLRLGIAPWGTTVLALAACGGEVGGSESGLSATASGGSGSTLQPGGGQAGVAGSGALSGGIRCTTQSEWDVRFNGACAGVISEVDFAPSFIQFLVDTSGSMTEIGPNTGARTKWDVTRDAINTAIEKLPRYHSVGLLPFPNEMTVPNTSTVNLPIETCVNVAVAIPLGVLDDPGSQQRNAIADCLSSVVPQGSTPTADAYHFAVSKLTTSGTASAFPPMIVLVTDGAPNIELGCRGLGQTSKPVDAQPLIQAISDAWSYHSIKTFVIGLPGSESASYTGPDPRIWMSQAASAGMTASPNCSDSGAPNFCHVDLTAVPDLGTSLVDALVHPFADVASRTCYHEIPNPPAGQVVDITKVTVAYTGSSTGSAVPCFINESTPDCSQGDGWYIENGSTTIKFCAKTCAMFQDPELTVSILATCATPNYPK